MITVHRRLSSQWVKLSEDDEAEFQIRPLNSLAIIDVENGVSANDRGQLRLSASGVQAAIRAGLTDWKGIKDEVGNDLKFSARHIEWLPPETLLQLALRIYDASRVTESERKNS